jgi:hypothetical protein
MFFGLLCVALKIYQWIAFAATYQLIEFSARAKSGFMPVRQQTQGSRAAATD